MMGPQMRHAIAMLFLAPFVLLPSSGQAQESSLFHQPVPPQGAAQQAPSFPAAPPSYSSSPASYSGNFDAAQSLAAASWTYQPAPPMRVFTKNDIITIRVDEIGRMLAQGDAQKRRTGQYRAILTDWLKLSDGKIGPALQADGDPAVGYSSNDGFRNQSTLESRETLTFNIAATIVDIRSNGNLVLEARKTIHANDNTWETSLAGTCRAIDVGPDNVVLSKDLLNLEIFKEDQGQLRDGYKRGWFTRWFDRLQPF